MRDRKTTRIGLSIRESGTTPTTMKLLQQNNGRQSTQSPKVGPILESPFGYLDPPAGSSLARELVLALRDNFPHRPLVVDGLAGAQQEYTGQQLWERAARLATGLMQSELCLELAEPVLMMCERSIDDLCILFASAISGATLIGMTAYEGLQDMRNVCEPTRPQVLVASPESLHSAQTLRQQVDGMASARILLVNMKEVATSGKRPNKLEIEKLRSQSIYLADELFNWPQLDEQLIWRRIQQIDSRRHLSMYMMTSGSTGRSKIVPWTHQKQLSDIWSVISATKSWPASSGHHHQPEPLIPIDARKPDSLVLAGDLPLDQGAGVAAMLWCLIMGGKYVMIDAYDEDKFWFHVTKHKITMSISSATFAYRCLVKLHSWLEEAAPECKLLDIGSMKFIACVGLKVDLKSPLKLIKQHYRELRVTQFLGVTELGFISMLPAHESPAHLDSVGCLFPGVRAKVEDLSTGQLVGPNQEGELLVWSPSLFEAYVPHPDEKLEDLMRDRFDSKGFYRTGDIVHYDSEERLYIHGRIKDTLYLNEDWKTPPSEIERVIDQLAVVDRSVVVGVPDPKIPHCVMPKAFIKLKKLDELDRLLAKGDLTKSDRELAMLVKRREDKLSTKSAPAIGVVTSTTTTTNGHSKVACPPGNGIISNGNGLVQTTTTNDGFDDDVNDDRMMSNEAEQLEESIKRHIFEHTAVQLTHPKRLHGGIRFLEEFPTVGLLNKIDRRTLESMD